MPQFWPADVHLIGKDIVRFHAVYWPAFLMCAGLAAAEAGLRPWLPAQQRREDVEVARQRGRSVELADRFGVDPLRYFLLREVTFGQDGSYSAEAIVNRGNAELANSFGNLAQRTLSMIFKNLRRRASAAGRGRGRPGSARRVAALRDATFPRPLPASLSRSGIEAWLKAVFACNAYVDAQAHKLNTVCSILFRGAS